MDRAMLLCIERCCNASSDVSLHASSINASSDAALHRVMLYCVTWCFCMVLHNAYTVLVHVALKLSENVARKDDGTGSAGKSSNYRSNWPNYTPNAWRLAIFQKKITVVKYMRANPTSSSPCRNFGGHKRIVAGYIGFNWREEVQLEIVSVIVSFVNEMASCTSSDIEFIEATGKSLCVPAQQKGLTNISGQGELLRIGRKWTGVYTCD